MNLLRKVRENSTSFDRVVRYNNHNEYRKSILYAFFYEKEIIIMDKEDQKNLLKELGYSLDSLGSVFFLDLVGDVISLLEEQKSKKDIKILLPRYYLEYYHFYYEIGRYQYLQELESFCQKRKQSIKTNKRFKKILRIDANSSVEDTIISFSQYCMREKHYQKTKVKLEL